MTIMEYSHSLKPQWTDLFTSYFLEDLNCELSEDIVRGKLCSFILEQWEKGIIRISVCSVNERPMGFSIYQIDSPESDWCKRPGWGCIREFYIAPEYRRQGCGRKLSAYSEEQLRQLGASRFYLTAEDAIPFWECCGYSSTDTLCSNEQTVLVK